MLKLLCPRQYVARLADIDLSDLRRKGICALLLDLDNTLVPRDEDRYPEEVVRWLEGARGRGFKLCIVSNNTSARVLALASALSIPAVPRAIKPFKRPFLQAMGLLGVGPAETAVIGDQLFTDVLGGNRLGLYTILVVPLQGRDFWATSLVTRPLERLVLCFLGQRRGKGAGLT